MEQDFFQFVIATVIGVFGLILAVIQVWQARHEAAADEELHGNKIKRLMEKLTSASAEVTDILNEMKSTIEERNAIVMNLEEKLGNLNQRKEILEQLVDDLEEKRLSSPVIEQIINQVEGGLEKEAKKGSRRELFFFFVGLLFSVPLNLLSSYIWRVMTGS